MIGEHNNTRCLISTNSIVQGLTKEVSLALPGLHALTGCDYIPDFLNKGKVGPLDLVINTTFSRSVRKPFDRTK